MENKSNKNLYVITPEMVIVSAFYNKFPQYENKGLVNKFKNSQRIKESINFFELDNICKILNIMGPKSNVYCNLNFNDLLKYMRKDWKFYRSNKTSLREEVYTELSRNKISEIYLFFNPYVQKALQSAIKINDSIKQKQEYENKIKNAKDIEFNDDINKGLEK